MRYYPLVCGQNGKIDRGDSHGRELRGLDQYLHVNNISATQFLKELEVLGISGSEQQLSKARHARSTLSIYAEDRIMGIISADSIEELCEPSYDEATAARIKKNRERVAGDEVARQAVLDERHRKNLEAAG